MYGLLTGKFKVGQEFKDSDGQVLGIITFVCDEYIKYTSKNKVERIDGDFEYHMMEVELDPRVGNGTGHPYSAKGEFSVRGREEPSPVWW